MLNQQWSQSVREITLIGCSAYQTAHKKENERRKGKQMIRRLW